MSVRKKIFMYFLGVSIIPMVVLTSLIIRNSYDEAQINSSKQLQIIAGEKTDKILQYVKNSADVLEFISGTPAMAGIIRSTKTGVDYVDASTYEAWENRLTSIFKYVMTINPDVMQVRLFDPHGIEKINALSQGGKIIEVLGSKLQDKSERYFIQETLKKKKGEIYISNLDLYESNRTVSKPYKPVLRFCKPIYDDFDTIKAILIVNFDMSRFLPTLHKYKNIDAIMIDQDGTYLIHPDSTKTFSPQMGTAFNYYSDFPNLKNELRSVNILQSYSPHDKLFSSWQKVFFDPSDPRRHWVIITQASRDQLIGPIDQFRNYTLGLVGLFSVLTLFLAFIFSDEISKPIHEITKAAQKISEGNMDTYIPENADSKNEISMLAKTINQMSTNLKVLLFNLNEAKNRAKQQRNFSDLVIERSPQGLILVDRDGYIRMVNEAVMNVFGYEKSELIGQNVDMLVPDSIRDGHHDLREKFHANPGFRHMGMGRNLFAKNKNGKLFPVEIGLSPIQMSTGQYVLVAVSDLTKRIEYENSLKSLNEQLSITNKELEGYSYVISHDLKAPLRGIGSIVDWLYEDYSEKLDEEGKKNLQLLKGRVSRMNELIDGILHFSKIGQIQEAKEIINVDNLVKEVIDLLNPPKSIQITMDSLPDIIGVRLQIFQVFQNLISNALRYMNKDDGAIHITCKPDKPFWHFTVSDNGPGIAEEYHEKIFKIFQTLQPRDKMESTGIGLTIVKKIIELHGGNIWVESEPGKGAAFHFILPDIAKKEKKGEKNEIRQPSVTH